MAQPEVVDVAAAAEQLVAIALPAERRGWMRAAPADGLDRPSRSACGGSGRYWHPALRVLVYPTPETPAAPLPDAGCSPATATARAAARTTSRRCDPTRPGDSPRRIAWKAMARTASDELLTKQFDGGERGELLLDW